MRAETVFRSTPAASALVAMLCLKQCAGCAPTTPAALSSARSRVVSVLGRIGSPPASQTTASASAGSRRRKPAPGGQERPVLFQERHHARRQTDDAGAAFSLGRVVAQQWLAVLVLDQGAPDGQGASVEVEAVERQAEQFGAPQASRGEHGNQRWHAGRGRLLGGVPQHAPFSVGERPRPGRGRRRPQGERIDGNQAPFHGLLGAAVCPARWMCSTVRAASGRRRAPRRL